MADRAVPACLGQCHWLLGPNLRQKIQHGGRKYHLEKPCSCIEGGKEKGEDEEKGALDKSARNLLYLEVYLRK